MTLDRRTLVKGGLLAAGATLFAPRIAFAAAPTDARFIFIIQRGAADGLHIVPPLGDPAYAGLRGPWMDGLAGARRLDDTFSLHPLLERTGQMFGAGQALAVHAVASVYRDRSHFDGQNILETGGAVAYVEKTGWMNRLIGLLPQGDRSALAIGAEVPVALSGPERVASYTPARLTRPDEDLLARVSQLYEPDAQLSGLWAQALATRAMVAASGAEEATGQPDVGRIVAALMRPDDGARIAMIESIGWDTHTLQHGRLTGRLRNLDALLGTLADGLGPAWDRTLVLVATEFGRTAAINGTNGTDHGTASAALLLGGGLKGGRVIADWPGLSRRSLYLERDLKPTIAMEGLISGALASHFGLDPEQTARTLFPAIEGVKPLMI